jgi:cytochrome d ubiquinol oxidase subunit I
MEMFFNPSNMSHIVHVLLSAWMTGAFFIMSIGAYYLLKKRYRPFAKRTIQFATIFALTTSLLQLVSADHLTRKVARYNPEKFASLEGVYETKPSTPAYLIGWVDETHRKVIGIAIPGLLSFLTFRDFTTPVAGLDQFPQEHWPWVGAVFQVYHAMVVMWIFMMIASLLPLYFWWKKRWEMNKPILYFLIISVLFPQIANIGGWYTSCMGRQPWTVYRLQKTKEAFSAALSGGEVFATLILFIILYLGLFALFLFLIHQKIKHGPFVEEEQLPYRDTLKPEKTDA